MADAKFLDLMHTGRNLLFREACSAHRPLMPRSLSDGRQGMRTAYFGATARKVTAPRSSVLTEDTPSRSAAASACGGSASTG